MASKKDIKKVVLAYSGGLDTSIIIPWLKENYNNCEVIAVSGNVGQADELEGLEEKALKTGASKLYVLDLTDEYVDDYIIPTMQAGAIYEEYLLGTSHARPVIAKGLVEIALKENADEAYPYADVQTFLAAEPALDYAEKFGCDVLLCEINPPRLDGLFLAEKVKKINSKVNIIFVTVCSESEHAKAVLKLKPSGYLTKEATSAQILEELQNLRYPLPQL